MNALIGPRGWIMAEAGEITVAGSAPGVIGGAVIKAARRSAGLSRRDLASSMAVVPAVVREWESGIRPLFCVSYHELCQLADALDRAGARLGHEVDELVLASQCDLLITGILRGFEDYAEVPPVDEDVADSFGLDKEAEATCRQIVAACHRAVSNRLGIEHDDVGRVALDQTSPPPEPVEPGWLVSQHVDRFLEREQAPFAYCLS